MQTYLIVTPYFPTPASWRGAYVYDFAAALRRTGRYDVRVLVPGPGGDYTYQGIDVIRFPHRMLPSASFPFLFDPLNRRSFLASLRRAGIAPESVAVCHAHTALFAAYALAVKAVNPRCRTFCTTTAATPSASTSAVSTAFSGTGASAGPTSSACTKASTSTSASAKPSAVR